VILIHPFSHADGVKLLSFLAASHCFIIATKVLGLKDIPKVRVGIFPVTGGCKKEDRHSERRIGFGLWKHLFYLRELRSVLIRRWRWKGSKSPGREISPSVGT
jgi:hypothetical protein